MAKIILPFIPWLKFISVLILPAFFLASNFGCAPYTSESKIHSKSGYFSEIEIKLRAEAKRFKGVPHRYGGTTLRGIDCSGLVIKIYRDLFNIQLPRTVKAQSRMGTLIPKNYIQPGDLLFFKSFKMRNHVGIYMGKKDFLHVSSTHGVMISGLDEKYWRKTFWIARRVLTG